MSHTDFKKAGMTFNGTETRSIEKCELNVVRKEGVTDIPVYERKWQVGNVDRSLG